MTTATADFAKRLDQTADDTEALLAKLLSDTLLPDEIARPKRLMDAMRYSSLGGGKRLRPFLVVESAAVFGVPREAALLAGAALECIHCYSLIHDDLPAMDNTDLRRGRPTLHKKTDDATAILAGDGLLTLAFDIVTRDEIHRDADRAPAADARAGARLGHRRHGRRPDARPCRRRPVRRPRAGRRRAAAADEDRRAAALRLHRRRDPRPVHASRNTRRSTITAARSARRSRSPTICSTSKATRRRSASRPAQDAALGKTTFVTQLGIDGAKQRVSDLLARRRFRAVDLRRQGRRAAGRVALRRRAQELDVPSQTSKESTNTSFGSGNCRCPLRVVYGAAAHLHRDRRRYRRVLPAAGLVAAGRRGCWSAGTSSPRCIWLLAFTMMLRSGISHIRRNAVAAGRRPFPDPAADRARRASPASPPSCSNSAPRTAARRD